MGRCGKNVKKGDRKSGLDCEVIVDGAKVFDYDNLSGPLDGYLPDQVYIDLKYVFAFSVKKFKSFERYTDSSDI